jgi:hypothetical protein
VKLSVALISGRRHHRGVYYFGWCARWRRRVFRHKLGSTGNPII